MPLYRLTYRNYDGQARSRFRWRTIVAQDLRVLFSKRMFLLTVLAGELTFIFFLFRIMSHDVIRTNPTNPIAIAFRNMSMLDVNSKTFFDFVRLQSTMVFFLTIYAGASMIADDFRNNLMDVYFSKPLRWYDYVSGKIITLLLLSLSQTAVPGVMLVVFHNLFAPSMERLHATWWFVGAITEFSILMSVPCALAMLACSSLFRRGADASVAFVLIVVLNAIAGSIMQDLLKVPNYGLVSALDAVNYLGESMFSLRHHIYTLHWTIPAACIAIFSLLCLWVVCRRVKRAEVAS